MQYDRSWVCMKQQMWVGGVILNIRKEKCFRYFQSKNLCEWKSTPNQNCVIVTHITLEIKLKLFILFTFKVKMYVGEKVASALFNETHECLVFPS